MAEKKYKEDVDGTIQLTKVLLDLLNTFPLLDGEKIKFSTLSETSGIGFFPTSGAVILSNREDITGHVEQTCLYPFNIFYRAAPTTEKQRIRIKEKLDSLGKWLEKQPITLKDTEHKISDYPELTDGRVISSISRTNSGHLFAVSNDGIEDWLISASVSYTSEFDK